MSTSGPNDDLDPNDRAGSEPGAITWEPIDLLLNQGTLEEVAAMRDEVASDPMLALDLADTIGVIEQLRRVRTDASPEFAGKLQDVTNVAERFYRSHYQPKSTGWHLPAVMGLAATATFCLLWWLDAGRLLGDRRAEQVAAYVSLTAPIKVKAPSNDAAIVASDVVASDVVASDVVASDVVASDVVASDVAVTSEQASWEQAVQEIARRLDRESTAHMHDAFQAGVQDAGNPLTDWVDPGNTLRLLRLEHELRANADLRAEALLRRGALAEVDDRVQELADGLAVAIMDLLNQEAHAGGDALAADREQLANVASGVRALIAAGPDAARTAALRHGGDWLARRLPKLQGERLVIALSGLVEIAAVNGQHFDEVAIGGQRLVDEVLKPDSERWRRSLPELLTSRVAAGSVGEAGRVLSRLPAFGIAPGPCKLVRLLLLGQLRERRALSQDRPEVLAAMLYGCGDLLATESNEQVRISWALRRWKPTRLAPDFGTVQQLAWAQTPGSRGYTRLQGELRQLAVLPAPTDMRNCAAFCLCLATNFAGHIGNLVPAAEQGRPL